MLKNYLKMTLRSLGRQKILAFINVIGLALGIMCTILIFLYVGNENSYDRFHKNADRLYRIHITEAPTTRDPFSYVSTPNQLAGALEESFPEVERAVRIEKRRDLVRYIENSQTSLIHLTDPDFFQIFSFPLKTGDKARVLQNPDSVVLTESSAERFFGTEDPMGKRLEIKLGDSFEDFTVRGIAKNPPVNSSVQFEILIPLVNEKKFRSARAMSGWLSVVYETYVQLIRPMTAADMEPKLKAVVNLHYPERYASFVSLDLQPITDIHLNPDVPQGFEPTSNPLYSQVLIIIALLILVVACVNYMTLAVGRSAYRSREVGVRKVLGAQRSQVVWQFLGEAFLMSSLALLLGILFVKLFLPAFNAVINKDLILFLNVSTVLFLLGVVVVTGALAGSYPAFIFSRQQPILTIRRMTSGVRTGQLMRFLVVGQFALSIALISSALIMQNQLKFLLNFNLGFDKQQVVVINNFSSQEDSWQVLERFQNNLSLRREVMGVTGASSAFSRDWTTVGFNAQDGSYKSFYQLTVDYDFIPVMGINLKSGRNFSKEFGTDRSEAIIVNQALVDYFQWDDPLGKSFPGKNFPPHQIIGVVQNFHFESLHENVAPLAMLIDPGEFYRGINDLDTSYSPMMLNFIHVKLQGDDMRNSLKILESAWKEAVPGHPFLFSFLDQDVQQQYQDVERWGKIVGYSSVFTVLIACLGLFGLATLAVTQRTKEIGVRKVLGASTIRIAIMLTREFSLLVILANIVAWPLAFFAMRQWMFDFAYRAEIGIKFFVFAGVISLFTAVLTVGYQSIRAGLTDPAKTLRVE